MKKNVRKQKPKKRVKRTVRKPFRKLFKLLKIVFVMICMIAIFACVQMLLHRNTNDEEEVVYIDPVYLHPYDPIDLTNQTNGLPMYQDDVYTSSVGIDVSEHQGVIDFSTLKQQGISFVMVRCGYRGYSEGILHRDAQYFDNMKKAKEAGLQRGVYFFSQAKNVDEAIEEANYVISLVKDYDLNLPIGYDMEYVTDHDRIRNLTADEKTSIAKAFSDQLDEYGYRTYVYGSNWWLDEMIHMEDLQDHVKFWLAEYETGFPNFRHDFTMWQYSEKGQLKGINVPVDMNLFIQRK